ncbi:MAG TPA: hypothetical protein VIY48_08270 [Candidatus Paceibacterota bacterium]
MIPLWLMGLWAKVWKYVCALGALLLAIGGIWLSGRKSGVAAQKSKNDAREAKANIEAVKQVQAVEDSRRETDAEVAKSPDPGPQKVADAPSDSAAGKLRDDGWVQP